MPILTDKVKISHLIAVTAEGEELGRTTCGVHNMRFFSDSNVTSDDKNIPREWKLRAKNDRPVAIYAVVEGIAVGCCWVGFDGIRYNEIPFYQGPQNLKKGEWLEYPIGALKIFGFIDENNFRP